MYFRKVIAIVAVSATLFLLHSAKIDDNLLNAIRENDITRVENLLNAGANPNVDLDAAALSAHILEHYGVQTTQKDYFPTHPLLLATAFGNSEIVELLINRGSNIDFRNVAFRTALMIAANLGYTRTVRVLLDNGACTSIRNINDLTVLELYQQSSYQNAEITRMLKEREPVYLKGVVSDMQQSIEFMEEKLNDNITCRVYREGNTIQWFFDYWREIDTNQDAYAALDRKFAQFTHLVMYTIPISKILIFGDEDTGYDWTFSKVYVTLNEKYIFGWMYYNDCETYSSIKDVNESARFVADHYHQQF